jgi:hypothetical protein
MSLPPLDPRLAQWLLQSLAQPVPPSASGAGTGNPLAQFPLSQSPAPLQNMLAGQLLPTLPGRPFQQPAVGPPINLAAARANLLQSVQAGAARAGGRLQHSTADILRSMGIDTQFAPDHVVSAEARTALASLTSIVKYQGILRRATRFNQLQEGDAARAALRRHEGKLDTALAAIHKRIRDLQPTSFPTAALSGAAAALDKDEGPVSMGEVSG